MLSPQRGWIGVDELCRQRGVEPLPNPPIDPELLPEWFGERTD